MFKIKKLKIIFTLICLPITSLIYGQIDSTHLKHLLRTIDSSKVNFAPDARTKLVELTFADIATNQFTIQSTEQPALDYIKDNIGSGTKINYVLLPDQTVDDKPFGVVNLSVVNLRTKPSHAAEMATQLLLGTVVDILQVKDGEYRVRTPEGYIAYVPKSAIVAMNFKDVQKWKTENKLIYTDEFGKSYSDDDKTSIRVSDLVYGNLLKIRAEQPQFFEVSYPDGRIAFIPKEQGMLFSAWKETRELSATNLVNDAKSMLGLPYLWGGTSVKAVDCSGFTKTVFFMNGYIIPRDASQQALVGEEVSVLNQHQEFDSELALKNLQVGDLLFFAGNKNRNSRITHVALYIGAGEFIHAAGSVRINSFLPDRPNYDDFQTRTLVAVRRYINAQHPAIQKITHNRYY